MTLTVDRPEAVAKPEEPEHVRSGILNWLTSTDHKVIGKSYLVTSFLFFCMAGCMAILIRTQLAAPDNTVVSQHAYDELFTMHGSLMLYLFAGPLAFGGLANYLVPLQVGTPDMAFPRLNTLSYWLYLMGGLTMVGGFFTVGGAADRRRSLSQAVHRLPRSKQADQRPAAAPSGPDEEEDAVTMTETEALEAMLAHHRALDEHMGARAAAVGRAVASDVAYGPALADLVAYLADEVLPHALAEEHSIYQAAGARPDLADTVAEMTGEHRSLASAAEDLADAPNGPAAAARAGQIADLFGAHVRRENEVLLPALLADGGVDLAQLLVQMHRLTEAAQQESSFAEDASAPDTEALVLSLLLEAASELADTGRGDRACRLAASAWAALRVPRPELAVRVTAALHRLARRVAEEPVAFRSGDGRILGGGHHDAHLELDVRALAPAQRHESIFAAYAELAPGAGFVLVNDHDPKPLRYQFEAEHAGDFTWDSLEAGPEVWRVRIGRPPAAGRAPSGAGAAGSGEEPELDVRALAHGQRHESIFAAYAELAPGASFVLVNDHDPKALRYQFEAQHPSGFTWDYLEAGPKVWRVRIGRLAA